MARFGLFGDDQRNKKYHGGADRAVCLFSLERIRELQEEGHPITTGSTGENLTVAGIDWDLVTPEGIFEIGGALLEVTAFTTPCKTIRDSFTDRNFMRISHRLHPGWSRVYARVLREGVVKTGDRVTLSPEGLGGKGWLESLLS